MAAHGSIIAVMEAMRAAMGCTTAGIEGMSVAIGCLTAALGAMIASLGRTTAGIERMPAVLEAMVAAIERMPAVLEAMVAPIGRMTAVLGAMVAPIGGMTAVLGPMAAPLGRMPAVLGAMSAPIGLMTAVLGATIAPIGLMTAALEPVAALIRPTCTPLQLASRCPAVMTPPDSQRRPRTSLVNEALDEEAAPISEPRPSSPAADPGILGMPTPSNDTAAPLPPDSAPLVVVAPRVAVTRELTYAFLAKKATRDRIREVVEARVPKGTQAADVDDVIQGANMRAMETSSLAETVDGMRSWVSRIAQNHVIDHWRGDAKHLRWLNRSIDVQELPPDAATEGAEAELPADDPTAPPRPIEQVDRRMLGPWLHDNVETKADKLALEMLEQKATTDQTNAEIAAEFGMTEAAYDKRVQRFKGKWIPRWKKHKRDWLHPRRGAPRRAAGDGGVAVAPPRKTYDEAKPTAVPVLGPAPTASVVPEQIAQRGPDRGRDAEEAAVLKPP